MTTVVQSATSRSTVPPVSMAALVIAMFAMGVSVSFVFAALPPLASALGLSKLQIAMVMAPAAFVFVFANALWGPISERAGRKLVVLLAVGAAACVSAGFGFIVQLRLRGVFSADQAFGLLVLARILLALFAGGVLPASQAYVADATPPELRTRALALVGAGFAFGMVSGPGLAAAVAGLGAVAPFFCVAVVAALTFVFAIVALVEPDHTHRGHSKGAERTPLRDIGLHLATVALAYTAYGIVLQVTGFVMRDHFASDVLAATRLAGAALMVAAAGLVATQLMLAKCCLSFEGTRRAPAIGMLTALVALTAMRLSPNLAGHLIGMAMLGIGLGVVLPAALALLTMAADVAGDQGRVNGLSGAAQGLGLAVGPLTGAAAYEIGPSTPYAVAMGLAVIGCGLSILTLRRPVGD